MRFPSPIPEVPVGDMAAAVAQYTRVLGFTLDWQDEGSGIAGLSRGRTRLFLTDASFRERYKNSSPLLLWLNVESKAEVDELFKEWSTANARIIAEPQDQPWGLREFVAADLDGNCWRVFYDCGTAEAHSSS